MDKTEQNKILGLSLLIFIPLFTYIAYRNYALSEMQNTYAIYKGTEGSGKGRSNVIIFKTKDGIRTKANIYYNGKYEVGDTVWIKYSIRDPFVAEVIDTDYKKHMKNLLK